MTRAYSYLRFSTPEQLKGDSLRRQTEAAQQYADKHGLDLDTDLAFQDLGVSAYRGANIIEGALGQFIEAVDSGHVPKGSVLLVENLDRLSRDKIMPALNRFSDLLGKGIEVVTLSDGKRYDADSLNNLPDLMLSLLVMSRAHDESQMKSQRGRATWKNLKAKAREGHKISTAAPAWITLEGQEWKVDQAKARIVQRIFKMALEGHSHASITTRFNREKVPPIGSSDAWSNAYIHKTLRNHAVIGTFQPHKNIPGSAQREPEGEPIEGYFPAIVDKATFYRVQRAPKGVSGYKGRVLTNVLSGMLRCAMCGGAVHYLNKGGKRRAYVHCDNARRKFTCHAKAMHFDTVLQYVLDQVDLPTPWLLGQAQEDRRARNREQLEVFEGKMAETEEQIANLLTNLELTPSSSALTKRLAEKEGLLATLHTWHENVSNRVADLGQNGQHWEETRAAAEEFNRVMTGDDQDKIGAIRVRLNASLKKLIERVEVGPEGLNVIAKGALPVPELKRQVAKDGSFTFVEKQTGGIETAN